MFATGQIESVLAHWPVAKATRPIIESVPQGLSGSFVARVNLPCDSFAWLDSSRKTDQGSQPTQTWALKGWPPGTSAARIIPIHNLIRKASRECPLLAAAEPIDGGATAVTALDRIWELSPWVRGRPLPFDADSTDFASAGEMLARVHHALQRVDAADRFDGFDELAFPSSFPCSPSGSLSCVSRRRNRLAELNRRLPRLLFENPSTDSVFSLLKAQLSPPGGPSERSLERLAKSLGSAIEVLQRYWDTQCHGIQDSFERFDRQSVLFPIQTVLRDVHREHILFDPDTQKAAGVIDYDALGKDSPAADLARFAGSFDRPIEEVLEALAAGYRQVRSFSQCEMELARCLTQVNAIGGLANWVVWLILDRRRFACEPSVIQDRISHLIASNCRIW